MQFEVGKQHVLNSFRKSHFVVPNGINADKWVFNNECRSTLREMWSISQETPLIGIVARIDPIKDHKTFIRMAAECHKLHQI